MDFKSRCIFCNKDSESAKCENTFIFSVLLAILQLSPVSDFVQKHFDEANETNRCEVETCIVCLMADLLQKSKQNGSCEYNKIVNKICSDYSKIIRETYVDDSNAFLHYELNSIFENFENPFWGSMQFSRKCLSCNYGTNVFEKIDLEIEGLETMTKADTIDSLLSRSFAPKFKNIRCDKCQREVPIKEKKSLAQPSKVLCFLGNVRGTVNIKKQFSQEIDLSQYFSKNVITTNIKKYRLVSIVVQSTCNHYSAILRARDGRMTNNWLNNVMNYRVFYELNGNYNDFRAESASMCTTRSQTFQSRCRSAIESKSLEGESDQNSFGVPITSTPMTQATIRLTLESSNKAQSLNGKSDENFSSGVSVMSSISAESAANKPSNSDYYSSDSDDDICDMTIVSNHRKLERQMKSRNHFIDTSVSVRSIINDSSANASINGSVMVPSTQSISTEEPPMRLLASPVDHTVTTLYIKIRRDSPTEAIKRDDLMEYFLRFGEIQTLRLNSQRFFGSITYIQAESVAKACKNRNHKVNGYVIDVTKASYWNITRVFDQKLENDDGRVPLGWNSSDAVEMEFTEALHDDSWMIESVTTETVNGSITSNDAYSIHSTPSGRNMEYEDSDSTTDEIDGTENSMRSNDENSTKIRLTFDSDATREDITTQLENIRNVVSGLSIINLLELSPYAISLAATHCSDVLESLVLKDCKLPMNYRENGFLFGNLRKLCIENVKDSVGGIAFILENTFRQLKDFQCKYDQNARFNLEKFISRHKNLTRISIIGFSDLTELAPSIAEHCKQLKELEINVGRLFEAKKSLESLKSLKLLETLVFHCQSKKMSKFIEKLDSFVSLETLDLYNAARDNELLQTIAKLPNVKFLGLIDCNITNYNPLAKMRHLNQLYIKTQQNKKNEKIYLDVVRLVENLVDLKFLDLSKQSFEIDEEKLQRINPSLAFTLI